MTAGSDQSQRVVYPAHRRRTFAIAVVIAVVLLGIGLLVLVVMNPTAPEGSAASVSANFLGYTNNAAGKRVAVFSINNRSPLAIRRQWYYELQVLTNGTWKPQPTVRFRYGHGPVVPPNQSEIWTIDAPTADSRWRVWFPYVEDHGPWREMKKTIRRKLRGLGLPLKNKEFSYTGLTDEVEPDGK